LRIERWRASPYGLLDRVLGLERFDVEFGEIGRDPPKRLACTGLVAVPVFVRDDAAGGRSVTTTR
jgi:hypothetical protein